MTTVFFTRDTADGTVLWASHGSPIGEERKLATISPAGKGAFGLSAGNKIYLVGTDAQGGEVLWVSDGTPAGTVPLAVTAVPLGFGTVFEHGVDLNGVVYFASKDGAELWKTDGTQAGTALIQDFGSGTIRDMAVAGGRVFLVARDDFFSLGGNLWTTDGTPGGTVEVTNQDNISGRLASAGAYVVYDVLGQPGNPSPAHPDQLWASDGTVAGTFDLPGSPSGYSGRGPFPVATVGNEVFFDATDAAHGTELWRTDIANRNAVFVKDVNPGPSPRDTGLSGSEDSVAVFGGALYFTFFQHSLWTSNGTDAGTVRIANFSQNEELSSLVAAGDHLMFFDTFLRDNRFELWRSDGTAAGTSKVMAFTTDPEKFAPARVEVVGNAIYFEFDSGDGLDMWRSDGTAAGTTKVSDVEPAWEMNIAASILETNRLPMVALGDKLFFAASGPELGRLDTQFVPAELWVSDGTHAGTHLLKSLVDPGLFSFVALENSSSPYDLTVVGGTLFFAAGDGIHGLEVWKSDGTAAGTMMIKDISPDPNQHASPPKYLTAFADSLYFIQSSDLLNPNFNTGHVFKLWRTDGTEAGTAEINMPAERVDILFAAGDKLFATGADQNFSDQIWVIGGAGAAPVVLTTFVNGQSGLSSEVATPVGNNLFFRAFDSTHGAELWVSDGTVPGTHIVKDIRPGTQGAGIAEATAVGNALFFIANDGAHGAELWTSDGTDAGTHLVQNTIAGANSPIMSGFTAYKGLLFYQGADLANGRELWRSDGTDAGTDIVKNISAGTASSFPSGLTVVGDTLYFVTGDGLGSAAIWKTDGSDAGTVRVTDFNTFSGSRIVGATADHLYYTLASSDSTAGVLMRTDGTAAGPELVAGRYENTGFNPDLMANTSISLAAPPQGSDFQADGNDDYNPEGSDDVLFQHTTDGQLYFAAMNGGAFKDWGVATAPLGAQTIGGWGDVDRNGYDDVFIQAPDGSLAVALQNGSDAPGWLTVPTGLGAPWKLAGVADLNRDGYVDAIVQDTTDGAILFASMAGGAFQGLTTVNSHITADWHVVGTGDVNGDGFVDVVIQQQSTGTTYFANMAQGAFNGWGLITDAVTPNWIVQAVADVNGDAHADVIFQNLVGGGAATPAGTTYWADLHTGSVVWGTVTVGVTADWVVKGTADVNDDGFSDVIFQNLIGRPPSGNDSGIVPGTAYYAEVNGGGVNVPSWGLVSAAATAEWHVV